jgi:RHS repeat-associated protein
VAGGGGNGNNTAPKAFVTILILDKDYKLLDVAWQQVSTNAEQVGVNPTQHEYLMREYTVKEAGYAFVYVSNENATMVETYFDDVTMTHSKGNVIQYNEYYASQLQTSQSWTRENVTGNNFLANGSTELNPTSNFYDLEYRTFDPVLMRMNGVDPMADQFSSLTPYNYSFNDPVTYTDPSGACPDCNNAYEMGLMLSAGYDIGSYERAMDPAGGGSNWGGYGMTNGWSNFLGTSAGETVSSWNANFIGPVYLGLDYNNKAIYGLPTDIARAGGAQSYYNIAYNYSMSMTAFGAVQNPIIRSEGYSGHFSVENGRLNMGDASFYRWGIEVSSGDIIARGGPGDGDLPQHEPYGFWEYFFFGGIESDGIMYRRDGTPIGKVQVGYGVDAGRAKIGKLLIQQNGVWKWAINGRVASKQTLEAAGLLKPNLTTTLGKPTITKEFVETASGVQNSLGPKSFWQKVKESIAIFGQLDF